MGTKDEWLRCRNSVFYFAQEYVEIFSAEEEQWIQLDLWPFQLLLLNDFITHNRIVILKARQLGFTTLTLVYMLWRFTFYPGSTIGLFSRGEIEAMDLLERLVKMYRKLPDWMHADKVVVDNMHLFEVSTGSSARALSTKKGESFTFKYLLFDEFDRFPDAKKLMENVKPTADAAGSQMIIGSIADKDVPKSPHKNIYTAAKKGDNDWFAIFMPWTARPGRDLAWYLRIWHEALIAAGGDVAAAKDDIWQQYPGNDMEALAPRQQGKRVPYSLIQRVYIEKRPLQKTPGAPYIHGLKIYVMPEEEGEYVIGADPAEGVPGGNDSSARILNLKTGEEVAALEGKYEPKVDFPKILFDLASFYNDAALLIERNNHGHAVIAGVESIINATSGTYVSLLLDLRDNKEGWLTSPSGSGKTYGKAAMYDTGAQHVKDGLCLIHDDVTVEQLGDIDVVTLKGTTGNDDCADAFVLACVARTLPGRRIKGKVFQ